MMLKCRHIMKAFTWRICATIVTIISVVLVTGSVEIGLILGPIDFSVKIVMYYFHERVWMKNRFGLERKKTKDAKC